MKGKTVVATGATSGIGEAAVLALAAMGARIVFVARDEGRAKSTMRKLQAKAPGLEHRVHLADLSSMAETRRVGAAIAASEPRVDVLVNNAGAMFGERRVTPEGLELTFALNHMAYFVLTQALREKLVASAPARIVSTASDAHQGASLDFDDLQSAKGYSGFKVYGRSKLANILFTRELARSPRRNGSDGQLPPSRRRRDALRRFERRLGQPPHPVPQAILPLAGERRRHDRLPRLLTRGRKNERRVFRQAQDHGAVGGGARRRGGEEAMGGEREAGRDLIRSGDLARRDRRPGAR